jgi:hypothetical protein
MYFKLKNIYFTYIQKYIYFYLFLSKYFIKNTRDVKKKIYKNHKL